MVDTSRENSITPASATGGIEQARSERKSKLVIVREQLQANSRLFYAGEIFNHPPAGPGLGYWIETVDIIVAPVNSIFDIKKLNEFMDGLIDVESSSRDAARQRSDGGIELGKLYYDESIGTRKQEIKNLVTAVDPEALQRAGITIGETHRTVDEEIRRRTWVRVYPDTLSAQTICEYEQGVMNGTVEPNSTFNYLQHWIDGEQVRRMRENQGYNPFSRIAGILNGRRG